MNDQYDVSKIIKVTSPERKDVWSIRFLICCGLVSMLFFISWFVNPEHIGYSPLYYFLTFALGFKLLKMVHEWYHYWSVSVPEKPRMKKQWTVDILTTACPGEPREMIINTLKAMCAVKYPHTNYLCDEGNDPLLKKACDELGVIHVTRTEKKDAKAGNINNALKNATGEICVILDPDHEPLPDFLHRVLPYFEDDAIGYVQCVQAYKNQSESFIARGAAEQTYHFYGPMMMCMNTYGTVQVIGANCTFRRKALDSIGGHAAGLAEDMHTAMQLNAKGWKSVYVPEILTRGLVPATLSAYYKQQLKWSRGAFELLFRTYPSLFKKLNWRQKIHYVTIPLYFLFGLINLIDILVPLLALCLAEVPWSVNVKHFGVFFLPLFGLSLLIRLYAQQWVLEKNEKGLHISGGILRMSSWWILLIGFIYAIFNIKVPYIPTPKEDEHQNYWKLSIPNLLIIGICIACACYGLSIDWTPYSMAMASYGGISSIILGYAVLMSQQRFILNLKQYAEKNPFLRNFTHTTKSAKSSLKYGTYAVFRKRPMALSLGLALLFLNYGSIDDDARPFERKKQKDFGGFYTGVFIPEKNPVLKEDLKGVNIVSLNFDWKTGNDSILKTLLNVTGNSAKIPMLNWDAGFFPPKDLFYEISVGDFDDYLKKCGDVFRSYKEPVFLNFFPGADDPKKYVVNERAAHEFQQAWQYAYTFFNNLGISNITWVWNPHFPSSQNYYPGTKFVDWIGVSCLNYGDAENENNPYSFSQLYLPFRTGYGAFQKPVMITEFGTTKARQNMGWFKEALADLNRYNEIRSAIIYTAVKEFPVPENNTETIHIYKYDFITDPAKVTTLFYDKKIFSRKIFVTAPDHFYDTKKTYKSKFITGKPGNYKLLVQEKSWYIRGVSYNTEHDWRDGNMPLTRKQLEKDFKRIRDMGANTIRRYDFGIYDKNILNVAERYQLKVLYGFWFDPAIDYYKDSSRIKKYISEVENKVRMYKSHPAVLAWSLGNETWGLLKHRFSKPYLVKVRNRYVQLVEYLARRIHELDPNHPVFSCMEHEIYQLPGELAAFHDGAPSVDVIGVNSYYREQISTLNHTCWQFDSLRPYLVSEFGPKGYWDPAYNNSRNGSLIEETEKEKSDWYKEQWMSFVKGHEGYNVGGFAYCWHDRMEGSNTWFGLTDYKGRAKPAYYALKELWTGKKHKVLPQQDIIALCKIRPGTECIFYRQGEKPGKQFTYEWRFHKEDYLEETGDLTEIQNGSGIKVKIPAEASDYRLYLYVTDEDGNVTTASLPVKVK